MSRERLGRRREYAHANERRREVETTRLAIIGKQTLLDRAGRNGPSLHPGKQTLVEHERGSATIVLADQIAFAKVQLRALEEAIRGADANASLLAAGLLRQALDAIDHVATREEHELAALGEIRAHATRLLGEAFSPSKAALDEAVDGTSRERWDREVERWRQRPVGLHRDTEADRVGRVEQALRGRSGEAMPHRSEMERAFGNSFAGVAAHTGMAAELAPLGARALAIGDVVAFADANPSAALVAHEATHVIQQRRGRGGRGVEIAARESDAEREAEAVATRVAHDGAAALGPVTAAPAGRVHLDRVEVGVPESRAAVVSAEPEIKALLAERFAAHDIPKLQRRKAALLRVFGAIPTVERAILRPRLCDRDDELGKQFAHALSSKLRAQLLAVLDGQVVPMPTSADSVEMAAFATAITEPRFVTDAEVVLDGAWRKSQRVGLTATAGYGPPVDEAAPKVNWHLRDRMGERRASGNVTWAPAAASPPSIELVIDEVGRWSVAIEVVHAGKVIAALDKAIVARSANEHGDDLPALVSTDISKAAEAMSDGQVVEQLANLRGHMGRHQLGSRKGDEVEYRRLVAAIDELEWQKAQRGLVTPGVPAAALDARHFDASDRMKRAAIQQTIDGLVARYGLDGAEARLHDAASPPGPGPAQGAGAGASPGDPLANEVEQLLRAELATRRAEASAFVDDFDRHARAIAHGLLNESETRLRRERDHYGLAHQHAIPGTYANQGAASNDVHALAEAIEFGKQIRAAHDRLNHAVNAGGTAVEVEKARRDFEAIKLVALAKHPMLATFLEGQTRQAAWAPTGSVPGALTLGSYDPAHFGMFMGWEINNKLDDLVRTRANIEAGKLSLFGVPKVVELAKINLHVAPGTAHDGVINERCAHDAPKHDDDGLLAVLTLALGLLLAVPTGGTSLVGAGVAVAGEVTLLAADLYMVGKELDERSIYQAATNTDASVVDALLQEEPSAGPLILRILGVVGPAMGARAVGKGLGDLTARVARARTGIAAIRAMRHAADAAGHAMSDPQVVKALERVRSVAREAGMADEEIDALVRTIVRRGIGGASSVASGIVDASAAITKEMTPVLARRMGVESIEIGGVAGEVGVIPTMRGGHVVVEKIVVGPTATVGDLLAHRELVDRIVRYDGLTGKVREVWDGIAQAVTGIERRNPHAAFTGAHEAFEEIRKYEQMIRGRMKALVSQLASGTDGAAMASRLEDELLVMEGELSRWRDVLDEVSRTGDPGIARGLIEARDPGAVTEAALAADYPVPPPGAFYRHWPNGGPEGQVYQLVGGGKQVRRGEGGWVLGDVEGSGKVPRSFDHVFDDAGVFRQVRDESPSLRAYIDAMTSADGPGMSLAEVERRAHAAVKKLRSPRDASPAEIEDGARRMTDADKVRHAIKVELRSEFFARAEREATDAAKVAKFRDMTDGLNPTDMGNLREEFLARRDQGSIRHIELKGEARAKLGLSQDREIDRVSADGSAVEVKSGKKRLGTDERDQMEALMKVVDNSIPVKGRDLMIKQLVYEFMDPDGVQANLDLIEEMLTKKISVKIYNKSGESMLMTKESDLDRIEVWLAR